MHYTKLRWILVHGLVKTCVTLTFTQGSVLGGLSSSLFVHQVSLRIVPSFVSFAYFVTSSRLSNRIKRDVQGGDMAWPKSR